MQAHHKKDRQTSHEIEIPIESYDGKSLERVQFGPNDGLALGGPTYNLNHLIERA